MNNKVFIQVGQRFFAVTHITTIVLDATLGVEEHPAVALYIVGDSDPWKFCHGTEEAEALMAFARGNTEVLAQPEYEIQ